MCEEERLRRDDGSPVHRAAEELRRGDADGWMLWHRVRLDAEMRMAVALALRHGWMREMRMLETHAVRPSR